MLHARLKAETLKTAGEALKSLVEEVKLSVTPEGVLGRGVDAARVALVEVSLKKEAFDSYSAQSIDLGVDLDRILDVLRLASSGDIIGIDYKPAAHRLVFTVGNVVREMSLLDVSSIVDPKVPKLDFPAEIVIPGKEFERAIRAATAVAPHVAFVADPDHFEISGVGEQDSMTFSLDRSLLPSLKAKEKARSLLSLDYLQKVAKLVGSTEKVKIDMGTDQPVRIQFEISEGSGHILYLIAPRIES